MCRISGGFAPDLKDKIFKMADALKNGGDSAPNFYFDGNFCLSHNRLAILDLSQNAAQPMQNSRFVIAFNGEIYNYKQIALELGINASNDTYILLNAYTKWGQDCLEKLEGIFAFCIYDKETKNIFLARDRYGVKPLYYYFQGDKFIFASELKAFFAYDDFDKNIDKKALSHFLNSGYLLNSQSIFSAIKKLQPSHFLEYSHETKKLKISKYYDLKSEFNAQKSFEFTIFKQKLENSILSRTESDVGFSLFLSGGIDSSLSACILAKNGFNFPAICVSFNEVKYDESIYAQTIAKTLNIDFYKYNLTSKIAQEIIANLATIYDEPFGDSSAIATTFLCQKARAFSKVALSSDGGDELNFGYNRYNLNYKRFMLYKKIAFFSFLFVNLPYSLLRNLFETLGLALSKDKYFRIKESFKAKNFMELYSLEFRHFKSDEAKILGLENEPNLCEFTLENEFESMSFSDISTYLCDDIFVKTDRAGMSVALEVREPFMNHEFVSYAIRTQSNLRANKILLKQFLSEYLPSDLINRPKSGFDLPLQEWFLGDLSYLIDDVLLRQDFFDKTYIFNLVKDFRDGKRINFAKIWHIFVFLSWKKQWKI